jgi:predicted glycosyltransferase
LAEKHFANFRYANPDQNLLLDERADLIEALAEFKPDLVVVDRVNAP